MGQGGRIVVINATPYLWVVQRAESYQMNSWPFRKGDAFHPGTNTVLYIEFSEGLNEILFDDSGEAEILVYGLNQSFEIRCRYLDIQASFGDIKLANPPSIQPLSLGWIHNGATNFCLAGNKTALFTNGNPGSWMQNARSWMGKKPLRELTIPGSHDSGMSMIDGHTAFGNARNCKTQNTDIAGQLRTGARFFDIRPVISNGVWKAGHFSYVGDTLGWQGAQGQSIDSMIAQINEFTAANAELIMLRISHFLDTDAAGRDYGNISAAKIRRLKHLLLNLDNRFLERNPTTDITRLSLDDFIGNGRAAVVILFDDYEDLDDALAHEGFYNNSQFSLFDRYANTDRLHRMARDQLAKMREQRALGRSYVLLSWTLTLQGLENVTNAVASLGRVANNALAEHYFTQTSRSVYPNVILVDVFSTVPTTLAIANSAKSVLRLGDVGHKAFGCCAPQ